MGLERKLSAYIVLLPISGVLALCEQIEDMDLHDYKCLRNSLQILLLCKSDRYFFSNLSQASKRGKGNKLFAELPLSEWVHFHIFRGSNSSIFIFASFKHGSQL